jgi:ubiquinone/menaquinone biosynthesis C-methylase UbiE
LIERAYTYTEIPQIRDYPKLLAELANVLRPGGVLLFADGEMQLYDEEKQPLPVAEPGEESFSWTQRVFHATYNSMKTRGSQVVSIFQYRPSAGL